MCAGLRDATGNDVRDNVARLDPGKEQLADLAESADRVEVRLAERTHPNIRHTAVLVPANLNHTA